MAREEVKLTNEIYAKLVARYNDIVKRTNEYGSKEKEIFDINPHLCEGIKTIIDINYINTHFQRLLSALDANDEKEIEKIKNEIHSSFGVLSENDQKYAQMILRDLENKKIEDKNSSFGELLNTYKNKQRDEHIKEVCDNLGADENAVKVLINERRDENNLNQNNDFENIMDNVDLDKAGEFLKDCGENIKSLRDVKKIAKQMIKEMILKYASM